MANNKIFYFDNIFYWLWRSSPSRGFPDRSYIIIAALQFAYLLLIVGVILVSFPMEIKIELYDNPKPIAAPAAIIFIGLLVICSHLYNKRKFQELTHIYDRMQTTEIEKNRKRFVRFIYISIIVVLADVLLMYAYHSSIATYGMNLSPA